MPAPGRKTPTWKNYYATQWADAAASGADAFRRWDTLEADTVAFRDSIFNSSLPPEIVDATPAARRWRPRTATVIRLEGGEVWAGRASTSTKVRAREAARTSGTTSRRSRTSFPALERTLRETELTYNQLPSGGLTFRQKLPLGSGFDIIGPCADGHFGAIVKTYREWKNSGDDAWLRRFWPNVKRAIEYAWSPGKSRPLGSGQDRRPLGAASITPSTWSCSARTPG